MVRLSGVVGRLRWALIAATALATGCANRPLNLPTGQAAYNIIPSVTTDQLPEAYRIGPSDTLAVSVFAEPDLSIQPLRVDISGNVNLPLIGQVQTAGRTTTELARDIETRLRSGGFLVRPQVTVNIVDAVSQRVTVEGEVNQPGVYQLTGPTTLLDVIAMSRGTTRIADLDEIAIMRVVDGEQMAARFDLRAIRRGEQPNPAIQGNDIVVVGFSYLAAAWRDFLQAVPAIAVFTRVGGL